MMNITIIMIHHRAWKVVCTLRGKHLKRYIHRSETFHHYEILTNVKQSKIVWSLIMVESLTLVNISFLVLELDAFSQAALDDSQMFTCSVNHTKSKLLLREVNLTQVLLGQLF